MYLFDTNVLSELVKRQPSTALIARLRRTEPYQWNTSVVTMMELRHGAMLREDAASFWKKLQESILSKVRVLDFTAKAALKAGELLADLQKRGEPVGMEDVLIASIALSENLLLVTRNTRRFERISGLKVENWF